MALIILGLATWISALAGYYWISYGFLLVFTICYFSTWAQENPQEAKDPQYIFAYIVLPIVVSTVIALVLIR